MAGCSKKQYAIMMGSGDEGKKLAAKMGSMEQEEFNKAFSELLGSGSENKWSVDDDEDYGDFDRDDDSEWDEGEDENGELSESDLPGEVDYTYDSWSDSLSAKYLRDVGYSEEEIAGMLEGEVTMFIEDNDRLPTDEELSEIISVELEDGHFMKPKNTNDIKNNSLKKSPKNDPRWLEMNDEYDKGKDLSVLEGWTYRRPWEASKESFERILSDEKPYNPARKEFITKYKDLIGSIIDYDTQRNNEYRDYLKSDGYKQSRLADLLDESDLGLEDFQDKYRKSFNSKYGYEENEPFYIHDLDTEFTPDEDYKRFKEAQEIEKTQGKDAANRHMNNRRINKKETLKRLIGNGEITIDELVNFLKGK